MNYGDGILQVEQNFIEHCVLSRSLNYVLPCLEVQSQLVPVPDSEQILKQLTLQTGLFESLPALFINQEIY